MDALYTQQPHQHTQVYILKDIQNILLLEGLFCSEETKYVINNNIQEILQN